MRRVVITGLGIVSSIGNDADEVAALAEGRPLGHQLRAGLCRARLPLPGPRAAADRRGRAHRQAPAALHGRRRGLRLPRHAAGDRRRGPGGERRLEPAHRADRGLGRAVDPQPLRGAPDRDREGRAKRMGPFMVTRCMSSTVSACLATPFKIKGMNYSITSACSTSAHCIGNGVEQIQWGKQDIVFAGGGEELDWTLSCLFDAMGAMSSKYNDAAGEGARAPSTPTATASSSRAAAAWWCWRSWSTRGRAARRSTPR